MGGAEGTTMRDRAVALAQAGWPVFQLKPNGKKPQFTGWQKDATCDPHKVHKMWSWPESGNPRHFNIGIAAGVPCAALRGEVLLPVDVDVKEEKKGEASLIDLVVDQGLDLATLTTISPTGSQHYYYATPEREDARLKNTVSHRKLGDGIDTRGRGGFVVAPGSEINGVAYRWANDLPAKEAPPWLVEVCSISNTGATAGNGYEKSHVDMPGAYERGLLWAVNQAPEAIQGQGGDRNTVVHVAMPLRDMGVSEISAVDILWEYWNPIKAAPPWTHDELQTKVYSAYRSAESAFGSKYREPAELAFSAVEVPDIKCDGLSQLPSATVSSRFPLVPYRQLKTSPEVNYLVKGFLPREGVGVLWGPPKCGKSFSWYDIAMHVAMGREYRGRRVTQGTVVYCAFEGAAGYGARTEAFRQHYKVAPDTDVPLFLMPARTNLIKDHLALIAAIRSQLTSNTAPAMVVLDTLNRSFVGSESKDEDMTAYYLAADALRAAFGCFVQIIHHCGLNGDRPRGHSSLTGAVSVQHAQSRSGNDLTIEVEFMRDGPEGAKIESRLVTVELGKDVEGDPITSCVTVPRTAFDPELVIPPTPQEEAWADKLEDWAEDRKDKLGLRSLDEAIITVKVAKEVWFPPQDGAFAHEQVTEEGESRETIRRHLLTLAQKKLIRNVKRGQWVVELAHVAHACSPLAHDAFPQLLTPPLS